MSNRGLVSQNTTTGTTYQGVNGNGPNMNAGSRHGVAGLHAALAVEVDYNQPIKTIGGSDRGAIPPFGLNVGRPH